MSVNSKNIQQKEFHIVFKGYKPEEVDKFLDLLAIEFEKAEKRNNELMEKIDQLKYERSNETEEMKKVLQEALVSAHKVAEDIKQKAKFEAEKEYNERKAKAEKEIERLTLVKKELEEKIDTIRNKYLHLKSDIDGLLNNFEKIPIDDDKEFEKEEVIEEKIEDKEENIEEVKEETPEEAIEEEVTKEEERETDDVQENEDFDKKKKNKSIDIANPDIIDDFFRTDDG